MLYSSQMILFYISWSHKKIVNFNFCTTIPYGNVRCFTFWPYHAVGATQRKVSGIFSLSFARIVFKSHTFGHFFACKVSFGVAAMIPQEIESIRIVVPLIAETIFQKLRTVSFFHVFFYQCQLHHLTTGSTRPT